MNIVHTVDTCGHCCPIPMISTLKVLSRIKCGECIEVKATDYAYGQDIKSVEKTGKLKIVLSEDREDYQYFVLKKTG